MLKLTPRQLEILNFIKTFTQTKGFPPTRAEIAQELSFKSVNAAEDHLRALERKGAIRIARGASRGISICQNEINKEGLPILGQVAAGSPTLALENKDQFLSMDASAFGVKADYLLKVKGNSMTGIGILDGDLIAVHKTTQAKHGQVIVARLDDSVTVKRLQSTDNGWALFAENPEFKPIHINKSHDFMIEGICVGVIRTHI